jgi:hypothetical protein
MKTLVYTLFMFCNFGVMAQNNASFFRAAYSMGEGNQVATNLGIQSVFGNPAGLTCLAGPGIYAGAENRFELKDLTAFQLAIALPVEDWGCFSFNLTDFGGSLYRDQKFGLAYARKLMKHLSVGVQLDWMIMQIENYGSRHSVTFDAGLQAQLTEELMLGFHLFSPYPVNFGEDRIVPVYIALGMMYRVSPQVELKTEIQKHFYESPALHVGLRYNALKALSISMGLRTEPLNAIITSGLSIRIPGGLIIDFGMNYHQSLGISSALGFSYHFKN